MKAVIMAGGYGARLHPYSKVLPKPLLPIDGVPLIERLIYQLIKYDYDEIFVSLGYKGKLVKSYLEDLEELPRKIQFITEDTPLGTAGALSKLNVANFENILVINCDVVSNAHFSNLLQQHKKANKNFSIVSVESKAKIKYGIIESKNDLLVRIDEKPELSIQVNSGIYFLKGVIINKYFCDEQYLDMTDIIDLLIENEIEINVINSSMLWFDVGSEEDFLYASEFLKKERM